MEQLLNEKASLLVGNEIWTLIFLVVTSTNQALRILYKSGVWLPSETGKTVARLGLRSLRAYKRLADLHVQLALPRFPIHTKFHQLFHTYRKVEKSSLVHEWTESPLIDACQQDEAFVGILSRFSRRVGPMATIDRTIDVYRLALHDYLKGNAN